MMLADINAFVTYALLILLSPVLTELVLVIRILAVFPPRHTPKHKLALVLAPTMALKIARFVTIGLFFRDYHRALEHHDSPSGNSAFDTSLWRVFDSRQWPIVVVFCALFDDASVWSSSFHIAAS